MADVTMHQDLARRGALVDALWLWDWTNPAIQVVWRTAQTVANAFGSRIASAPNVGPRSPGRPIHRRRFPHPLPMSIHQTTTPIRPAGRDGAASP